MLKVEHNHLLPKGRKKMANLFTRDDTFFGVCQGLGEDLGVSPTLFRLGFTLFLFFNPAVAIGTYFAAGLVVFASRMLFREPRAARKAEAVAEAPAEIAAEPMPLAA